MTVGEHVVETFVFFRGIVQLELRAEAKLESMDGLDASNQTFARLKSFPAFFIPSTRTIASTKPSRLTKFGWGRGSVFRQRAAIEGDGLEIGQVIGAARPG